MSVRGYAHVPEAGRTAESDYLAELEINRLFSLLLLTERSEQNSSLASRTGIQPGAP